MILASRFKVLQAERDVMDSHVLAYVTFSCHGWNWYLYLLYHTKYSTLIYLSPGSMF